MLVIPDFYDRSYVRDMASLILMRMGFKQLCVQQVIHPSCRLCICHDQFHLGIPGCNIWCRHLERLRCEHGRGHHNDSMC